MKEVLADIQDGSFARAWIAEHQAGLPNYRRYKQADLEHPIEEVGKRLRSAMPWLQADAQAAAPKATTPAAVAQPQEEAA
jgi:ketol-acid reductoisomerase